MMIFCISLTLMKGDKVIKVVKKRTYFLLFFYLRTRNFHIGNHLKTN